jgi:hypothetical protein
MRSAGDRIYRRLARAMGIEAYGLCQAPKKEKKKISL